MPRTLPPPLLPSPDAPAPADAFDLYTHGPLEEYRANFHALRQLLGRLLEPFGLLVTDYQALRVAGHGPRRPGAVSEYLAISPAATTELLDRLEARGLLRRDRDPSDRRATVITLTTKGMELREAAGRAYRRFLEDVTSELPPRDLQALQKGSRELREVLARRAGTLDTPPA